jgi:hypothetical protein
LKRDRIKLLGKKDLAFLGLVAISCGLFILIGVAAGSPARFLAGLALGGAVSIAGIAVVTALYRLRTRKSFLGPSDERVSMIVQKSAAIACFTLFLLALLAIVLGSAGLFGDSVDPLLAAAIALGALALAFFVAYLVLSRKS